MRLATIMCLCAACLVCRPAPVPAQQPGRPMSRAQMAERIKQFDVNEDGTITREEFKGPENIFRNLDRTGDGVISAEELAQFVREGPQTGGQTPGTPVGGIPADVKPLSEMSATDLYKGEVGGLYGNGENAAPQAHLEAALREAGNIQPLDADGNPSPEGKVGFISFGMSNTTQELQVFLQEIAALKLAPHLAIVDGAQGGKEATAWANESKDQRTGRTAWEELATRLAASGVSPPQVQVVWMKLAVARPAAGGDYPAHVGKFKQLVVTSLQKLKARYPNVRLVYLSNRIYAGYATTPLNPEPYAYEYAYGIRGLVLDQVAGDPELNYDPEKGEVKAPLLLWGPDLWANGTTARADGLLWEKSDLGPDGTHPSMPGRQKVARLLLGFLRTDPTAKLWFMEEQPPPE